MHVLLIATYEQACKIMDQYSSSMTSADENAIPKHDPALKFLTQKRKKKSVFLTEKDYAADTEGQINVSYIFYTNCLIILFS